MFEEWKRAWRDAVASFWRELDEAGPGAGSERVSAMRRDARAARAELDQVEAELNRARTRLAEERSVAEVAGAVEALAAGDAERVVELRDRLLRRWRSIRALEHAN